MSDAILWLGSSVKSETILAGYFTHHQLYDIPDPQYKKNITTETQCSQKGSILGKNYGAKMKWGTWQYTLVYSSLLWYGVLYN